MQKSADYVVISWTVLKEQCT